jgi:hypothetical protein
MTAEMKCLWPQCPALFASGGLMEYPARMPRERHSSERTAARVRGVAASLAVVLLIVGCSSGSAASHGNDPSSAGGSAGGATVPGGRGGTTGGTGVASGEAGRLGNNGGAPVAGTSGSGVGGVGGALPTGGQAGTGAPVNSTGEAGTSTPDAGARPDAGGSVDGGLPMNGGKALLVTGTIPLVGTDVEFAAALRAAGLDVQVIQEKVATPQDATGKQLIFLSYGMNSTLFNAEAFTDVPVPIIVTEHFLLPRLKMSTAHGYTAKMTDLTFVSDNELAGGLTGNVAVYSTSQEFFWGTPSPSGIRIAHIVGQTDQVSYFAYDKGSAMVEGAVAAAKRVQFFHASHSPDPVDPNLYLNATGLRLLAITISWCLK